MVYVESDTYNRLYRPSWFWAAYLMTTDKRGVSALLVQRQLGLSCYETAWMLLHKLRRAMVNVAREPLYGEAATHGRQPTVGKQVVAS